MNHRSRKSEIQTGSLLLLAGALLAATAPPAPNPKSMVRPVVSFELLFSDLNAQGEWLKIQGGRGEGRAKGWAWRPRGVERDWRPFSRGTWVVTDLGWYWLSEYPWGYVTSHYGRWQWRDGTAWSWVADREWSSAWGLWAYGEEGIGWRPMVEPETSSGNLDGSDPPHSGRGAGWTVVRWSNLGTALIPRPGGAERLTGANVLEAIHVSSATAVSAIHTLPKQGWKEIRPEKAETMVRNPGPDLVLIEAKTGRRPRPCQVLHTRRRREILLVGRDRSILVTFRPVIRESADEIQALITRKAEQYQKIRER